MARILHFALYITVWSFLNRQHRYQTIGVRNRNRRFTIRSEKFGVLEDRDHTLAFPEICCEIIVALFMLFFVPFVEATRIWPRQRFHVIQIGVIYVRRCPRAMCDAQSSNCCNLDLKRKADIFILSMKGYFDKLPSFSMKRTERRMASI